MVIGRFFEIRNGLPVTNRQYLIVYVLGVVAFAVLGPRLHLPSGAIQRCLAAVIVVGALLLEDYVPPAHVVTRFFVSLGDISYSTYLIHTLVLVPVAWAVTAPTTWLGNTLLFSLLALGIYGLSLLSFRHVEQNPEMGRLRKALQAMV
jgi:peptidoglycan/LPS O-acetylase OafA/YrhL